MAMDAFFELSGGEYEVQGETQDSEFKEKFALEVFSVEMGSSYPDVGPVISGTDSPTEKPQVKISNITFRKIIDNASSTLFLCCCQHTVFGKGKFTFRKASGGGKPVKYLQIELTKVTIQSVDWNIHGESGGADEETVKIAFGTICVKYSWQDKLGGIKAIPRILGWDVQKNQSYG